MLSPTQCTNFYSLQSTYRAPCSRDRTLATAVSKPNNNGNNHGISKKRSFALAVNRSARGVLKNRGSCGGSVSFDSPLEVEVGASVSNAVLLSSAFPKATSFNAEASSSSPEANPGDIENLSTANNSVSLTLSDQAPLEISYTITVIPFYGSRRGTSKSFIVESIPVPGTVIQSKEPFYMNRIAEYNNDYVKTTKNDYVLVNTENTERNLEYAASANNQFVLLQVKGMSKEEYIKYGDQLYVALNDANVNTSNPTIAYNLGAADDNKSLQVSPLNTIQQNIISNPSSTYEFMYYINPDPLDYNNNSQDNSSYGLGKIILKTEPFCFAVDNWYGGTGLGCGYPGCRSIQDKDNNLYTGHGTSGVSLFQAQNTPPPPQPTATDVPIGTINAPPDSTGSSEETLDKYFKNATYGFTTILGPTDNYSLKLSTSSENKIYVINEEFENSGKTFSAKIYPYDSTLTKVLSAEKIFYITTTG